jgi:hypothetical protein
VNLLDQLRLREIEHVVVALQVLGPIPETLASIRRLVQLALLDHRPHRAIEDDNPLAQALFELFYAGGDHSILMVAGARIIRYAAPGRISGATLAITCNVATLKSTYPDLMI